MWLFAWRNLLTRPVRTALALVGLSIPILGVIGLFSLSGAMRQLVGDTLSRIQGVLVVREGAMSPVLSDLPADLQAKIEAMPGVRAVTAEVWKIAPSVEGRTAVGSVVRNLTGGLLGGDRGGQRSKPLSPLDQPVVVGQDPDALGKAKSEVYPQAMLRGPEGGRYIAPGDQGRNRVVISTKTARDFPHPDGTPRQVGDTINLGGEPFTIIGLYETGSMFFDVAAIMPVDTARRLLNVGPQTVSSFYVEGDDPSRNEELTAAIERALPGVDARSTQEITTNFGSLMNHLDQFLLATVLLALIVGVVGIVNTMLMSTTERFGEFGVLRTNGWSRRDVLLLVSAESAYLGFLSGVLGFALAWLLAQVANRFLTPTGLSLQIAPDNAARALLLAVVMGTLGGLYPAWKASRMAPMAAIRIGG